MDLKEIEKLVIGDIIFVNREKSEGHGIIGEFWGITGNFDHGDVKEPAYGVKFQTGILVEVHAYEIVDKVDEPFCSRPFSIACSGVVFTVMKYSNKGFIIIVNGPKNEIRIKILWEPDGRVQAYIIGR